MSVLRSHTEFKAPTKAINWGKFENHTMLTDIVYKNQVVFNDNDQGRNLQLFDIVNDHVKSIPSFTSRICSGIILDSILYIISHVNEKDYMKHLGYEAKFSIYSMNLEKLENWNYCESISNYFEGMYDLRDKREDSDYPRMHKFGDNLMISIWGLCMSFDFQNEDSSTLFHIPKNFEHILTIAKVNHKIYISSTERACLCELDTRNKHWKQIDLEGGSRFPKTILSEPIHSAITLNYQQTTNLYVYMNRYILLNYMVSNMRNFREKKWRFIIYDTHLDKVEESRFYRMYEHKQCYGIWIKDSYLFYENIKGRDNFTSIYDIKKIVGNNGMKDCNFLRDRLDETEADPNSSFYKVEN